MSEAKKKGFNLSIDKAAAFINGASAEVLKSAPQPSPAPAPAVHKKGINIPARFHLPPELKKAVDVAAAVTGVKTSAIAAEALRSHPAVMAELQKRG